MKIITDIEKSISEITPNHSDDNAPYFERLGRNNGGLIDYCVVNPDHLIFGKGLGYSVAAGKDFGPYWRKGETAPVLYCDARMEHEASMRQWAMIHARNTDRESIQCANRNLKIISLRDKHNSSEDPGLLTREGYSLIREHKVKLVIYDDMSGNLMSPNDEYAPTPFSLQKMIEDIRKMGVTVVMMRDLCKHIDKKTLDAYLPMVDARISAAATKAGQAQGETCFVLNHRLFRDYDPQLVHSHAWSSWHKDSVLMFHVDPCGNSIADRNAEIMSEYANSQSLASVARKFRLEKSTIGRILGLYPRKKA
ncbi:hypothetical protein [Uliginosibacterium sp. 31-12]|uniref:hypothetical protein n=1 Tax=Uliginosibacterium sp. 31-12 TaxID=3062781 RepID=UPI0026E36C25|nr:hypothetical protein [Uliginosibacterium sp. 31-12]MDO6387915.1 hypothetical protein [Uliginosibacterium sp. 31-12]